MAKERQVAAGGDKKSEDAKKSVPQLVAEAMPEVAEQVADMFNTNKQYIKDATKLKAEAPEVFEQVKRGEKTITEVKKERKKEERIRQDSEARGKIIAGDRVDTEDTKKTHRVDTDGYPPLDTDGEYNIKRINIKNLHSQSSCTKEPTGIDVK